MKEIEPNEGPITLRMGKDNGKVGVGQRKPMGFNKTAPLKHRSDKNLRGREEKVLRVLKVLIVQEIHHATGKSIQYLNSLDLDHVTGRNTPGYEPLGAIFDPLNLQLIERKIHVEKTNAPTREGQRYDFRGTIEQEVMTGLSRKLLEKIGRVFTLDELDQAIQGMIYHESSGCLVCGNAEEHIDEGVEP